MIARWLATLFTYEFEIIHRKGSHYANADGLLRKPARKCKCEACAECHEICENAKSQVLCPVVTRQQAQYAMTETRKQETAQIFLDGAVVSRRHYKVPKARS